MDSDVENLVDDDDEEIMQYLFVKRPYVVRERLDHFEKWDEGDFYKRFRLSKLTVLYLLNKIEPKIAHKTNRNNAVSPANQLLLALRFYATGSFYIVNGDFLGIYKTTAGRIIKKVTEAITNLKSEYFLLPRNEEEMNNLFANFYNIARFPCVLGAIDCTHIPIQSPGGDNAELFRNRKGFFSLNVQAVCKSDLSFLDIVARWPGCTHDSLIFDNSALRAKFERGDYSNAIILGDGGYPNRSYMVTPIEEPRSRAEMLFNESQIRTRNVIERAFGVWKRRFPVLTIKCRCKLTLIQDIIIATAILHNITVKNKDDVPPLEPEIQNQVLESLEFIDNHPVIQADIIQNNSKRRELVDYFQSLRN